MQETCCLEGLINLFKFFFSQNNVDNISFVAIANYPSRLGVVKFDTARLTRINEFMWSNLKMII